MIKNIIFDIGNVLADFRYEKYMKELGFTDDMIAKMCEKVIVNPLWDELDLGIRPEADIIAEAKRRVPELNREIDIFFENIENIVESYDYAADWLKSVKDMGLGVYILSNYPRRTYLMHEKSRFTFMPYVDGKIISAFVQLSKPDRRIYSLLLDTYGLKAQECMFFDDRQVNIDAARQLGIDARLFTSYEDAKAVISELEMNGRQR